MASKPKTKQELAAENEELYLRLEEAEETLRAIRNGEVDALVVSGANGDSIFTLSGADRPYRVLIEAMSEGALTLSTTGVILYSNARFAEFVGLPLEHVIGTPLSQYAAPEDRQKVRDFLAFSKDVATRRKISLLCADGHSIPVQLSTRYVDQGDVQAICVVVTDLTSVVEREEALRRAHDELEQRVAQRTAQLAHSNELRLRFLAMISHELRTPLTSIKGFATTLLAEDVQWESDAQRDFLQTIDQEADKLSGMIDQILDLSSIEVGTLRINPRLLPLNDLMDAALPELQRIAADRELEIDLPDNSPLVNADPERIAQVLANLVSNATKYSRSQTRIGIMARDTGAQLRFSISDEGPGISPEDRPHIFEAFWRSGEDHMRHTKGAGLGLAICKGIVQGHGGRIWIEERAGPGTTVSFTLPISG
jgi:PAS domain S-box-containing protein